MRWLLFLSRLALICNVFFLLTVSIQVFGWAGQEYISSTIAIIGYFLAFVINPLTVFCYLIVLVLKRIYLSIIPIWLIVLNVVFLFLQLLFIIYLNDSRNY